MGEHPHWSVQTKSMTPSRTATTLLVPVGAGGAVSRCPVPYIAERGPTVRRAGLHEVELSIEQVAVGIQGVQQRIDYAYGPTSSLLLMTLGRRSPVRPRSLRTVWVSCSPVFGVASPCPR